MHTSNTARNSEKPPPPPPPPHPGETGHPQNHTAKLGAGRKGTRETQARDPTSRVWGPPR